MLEYRRHFDQRSLAADLCNVNRTAKYEVYKQHQLTFELGYDHYNGGSPLALVNRDEVLQLDC